MGDGYVLLPTMFNWILLLRISLPCSKLLVYQIIGDDNLLYNYLKPFCIMKHIMMMLLLSFSAVLIHAQEYRVKGQVKDANGPKRRVLSYCKERSDD